jgi:hypothetical protein
MAGGGYMAVGGSGGGMAEEAAYSGGAITAEGLATGLPTMMVVVAF